MNASEALDLFSTVDASLAQHLEGLPAKRKRTSKGLLESVVKLAYVLFAMGDTGSASQLVEPISRIPFANSYDYWTWVEAALVLKGTLALAQGRHEDAAMARQAAVAALSSGNDLQVTVKANVHKRFMDGDTLDTGFENAENAADEFEMRLIYAMALIKIDFFGTSEKWASSRIESELSESFARMRDVLADTGIYKVAPYK
ncbi:DUF6707 family protein [Xanthomonas campestris pv. campestris]|nr:DUF6707 family protein [Xanthomonas campestris pv. campestris]MEB1555159.1 DUF6707 family protein [Xanthomonas campestris pv. campestris]